MAKCNSVAPNKPWLKILNLPTLKYRQYCSNRIELLREYDSTSVSHADFMELS